MLFCSFKLFDPIINMSYPIWNLVDKSTPTTGTCVHLAGTTWSSISPDSFNLYYIDARNNSQTIWFRNLASVLGQYPVVYLNVYSSQGDQPNMATYMVKSLIQNKNSYTIGVVLLSSNQTSIGDFGSVLQFNFYTS